MIQRVVILCAGDGRRWGDYLGVPKQLIPFQGEPLLSRTVRQLRKAGYTRAPICVSRDPRLHVEGVEPYYPARHRWTAETLAATSGLWARRTTVLLGDVFFTSHALRRIVGTQKPLVFFGRPWPSAYTLSDHGELFALSFDEAHAKSVIRACSQVIQATQRDAWGNLWDVYHALAGIRLGSSGTERKMFEVIDDLTNDFDTPETYHRCKLRYERATSSSAWNRYLLKGRLCVAYPHHIALRAAMRPVRKSPSEYYRSRSILQVS
jgi:hypothetical protein